MSRAQLADFINATSGTDSRKTTYTNRVQPNAAYRKPVGTPEAVWPKFLQAICPRLPMPKKVLSV